MTTTEPHVGRAALVARGSKYSGRRNPPIPRRCGSGTSDRAGQRLDRGVVTAARRRPTEAAYRPRSSRCSTRRPRRSNGHDGIRIIATWRMRRLKRRRLIRQPQIVIPGGAPYDLGRQPRRGTDAVRVS
jgi:hypothetical protein